MHSINKEIYVADFTANDDSIDLWLCPTDDINTSMGTLAVAAVLKNVEYFTEPKSSYIHVAGKIMPRDAIDEIGLNAEAFLNSKNTKGGMVVIKHAPGDENNRLLQQINAIERVFITNCCD